MYSINSYKHRMALNLGSSFKRFGLLRWESGHMSADAAAPPPPAAAAAAADALDAEAAPPPAF